MRPFRNNNTQAHLGPFNGKHDSVERQPGASGQAEMRQQVVPLRQTATISNAQKQFFPADSAPSTTSSNPYDTHVDANNDLQRQWTESSMASTKDKKKGVSFLSRIPGFSKSKTTRAPSPDDEDNESVTWRPEGMDAQLFSHSTMNVGFRPRHPQPPGYIKVRTRFKRERDFDRLFLAQELRYGKRASIARDGSPRRQGDKLDSGPAEFEQGATQDPGTSESQSNTGAIWGLEFSKDGKYLAAAGQDKSVLVWAVISSREERIMHERHEEQTTSATEHTSTEHLSAPVFCKLPYRIYEGHTSTVIDLSWSKNNFLLSSSFDKTVRLWHVSRQECLVTFKHAEYCPSIQFHPQDDRFFLAGSLDTKLRLWSIPDKSVAFWQQLPEMITAVTFTPDGKTAIAGTIAGMCLFYDTEGLKYKSQISIKPSGRNAKLAKITGIQAVHWAGDTIIGSGSSKDGGSAPYSPVGSLRRGDVKLLISSNDSRIRLYNFRDRSMEMKFKGHKNSASQIRALLSDDARFVISGSEDCKTYIWGTGLPQDNEKERPLELFEANSAMTTGAVLAPRKTRVALSSSEDPVFDLCNPPPVTLLSRSQSVRTGSNSSINGRTKPDSSERILDSSSVQPTPAAAESGGSIKRVEESPAYLSRTAHLGGHIVVTADYVGNVKVFRQDCAYAKRRDSTWDSTSLFSRHSRRQGSSTGAVTSRLGRKSTRGSNTGSISSTHSRAASIATQPAGERILDWRQQVQGNNSIASASTGNLDGPTLALRSKRFRGSRDRSLSPGKSGSASSSIHRLQGKRGLRKQLSKAQPQAIEDTRLNTVNSSLSGGAEAPDLRVTAASPTSPDAVEFGQATDDASHASQRTSREGTDNTTSPSVGSPLATRALVQSPQPLSGDDVLIRDQDTARELENTNPLWLRGGRSYVFWNSEQHRHSPPDSVSMPPEAHGVDPQAYADSSHLGIPHTPGTELRPAVSAISAISKLSSEATSPADSHDENEHDMGAELKCTHCGSTIFKAKTVSGGNGKTREHRLVCQRCGTPAQ